MTIFRLIVNAYLIYEVTRNQGWALVMLLVFFTLEHEALAYRLRNPK